MVICHLRPLIVSPSWIQVRRPEDCVRHDGPRVSLVSSSSAGVAAVLACFAQTTGSAINVITDLS